MPDPTTRVLLHLAPGLRQAIDPADIFFLEAIDDDTHIRTRRAERLVDVRTLGELEPTFRRFGFVRIHRDYLVNLGHVRQVRRRRRGDDWELKLDPPVNRVLPIGRTALQAVWKAFGEKG
jgi:DNA-binding LytR/AlgR family response regulator